jgi:hypothetical protein
MPTLLIYPGTHGEPVALQDVLREAHDAFRDGRAKQIEARKKKRIPLDDSTDWPAVAEAVASVSLAHGDRDSAKVAAHARTLVELVDGNALEEIGAYEPDPALDGIVLTMAVVDDSTRRLWNAETQAAWQAIRAARVSDDAVAAQRAMSSLDATACKVVAGVIVKIEGIEGLKASIGESMPGLVLAGLLTPLYTAARHFLELPVGKAVRCGLPPQST